MAPERVSRFEEEVFWTSIPELRARTISGQKFEQKLAGCKEQSFNNLELEAPPGFEPGMEVLQI